VGEKPQICAGAWRTGRGEDDGHNAPSGTEEGQYKTSPGALTKSRGREPPVQDCSRRASVRTLALLASDPFPSQKGVLMSNARLLYPTLATQAFSAASSIPARGSSAMLHRELLSLIPHVGSTSILPVMVPPAFTCVFTFIAYPPCSQILTGGSNGGFNSATPSLDMGFDLHRIASWSACLRLRRWSSDWLHHIILRRLPPVL
jgi:hypothetical protein